MSRTARPAGVDLRPLAVTVLLTLAATALLGAAVQHEWLGPDVGRGHEFCERWHSGCIKQPVNTLSNLGFVIAGWAIAWRVRLPAQRGAGLLASTTVATLLASVIALLGPASAAMHATGTELGGALDLVSMHLVAGFAAAHATVKVMYRGRRRSPVFVAWFAGYVVLAQSTAWLDFDVPVLRHPENVAFLLLVLVTVVLEAGARREPGTGSRADGRWLARAILTLALAFVVWNLAQGQWCDPDSWLQGHAFWHLLCALSCWFLFRFYASEASESHRF